MLKHAEAVRLQAAHGVVAAAAAPPVDGGGRVDAPHAGDAAGHIPDGDGRVWVLAEMVTGKKVGDRVVPPAGHPCDGDVGLMRLADADGVEKPRLIHRVAEADIVDFCDGRISMARLTESCEGLDRSAGEDADA